MKKNLFHSPSVRQDVIENSAPSITEMCKATNVTLQSDLADITFPTDEINALIAQAPFIRGIEYLNQETAWVIWQGLVTEVIIFN